jgi:hypothetical protein
MAHRPDGQDRSRRTAHVAAALAMLVLGSPRPAATETAPPAGRPAAGPLEAETPGAARASESIPAGDSIQALVDAYIRAVETHDEAAYRALQVPYLDRCIAPDNAEAYAHWIGLELRAYVVTPPDIRISPVDAASLAERSEWLSQLSRERLGFDVPPTHYFELTQAAFFPPEHPCYAPASQRVRRFVTQASGTWRIVPQCLSPSMIGAVTDHMATQQAIEKMQADLYGALGDAERDELAAAIRGEGPKRAAQRYAEASGAGSGAALRLVERICEDL